VSTIPLLELRDCMLALDRFWAGIKVDIDPDLDAADVDYNGTRSGADCSSIYLVSPCGPDRDASVFRRQNKRSSLILMWAVLAIRCPSRCG
jgi:hypothetical protein